MTGNHDLSLCDGDTDWFYIADAATVTIDFTHANGDLDMASYDANDSRLAVSQSTSNSESLTVGAGTWIKVYGYQGAANDYTLRVE